MNEGINHDDNINDAENITWCSMNTLGLPDILLKIPMFIYKNTSFQWNVGMISKIILELWLWEQNVITVKLVLMELRLYCIYHV